MCVVYVADKDGDMMVYMCEVLLLLHVCIPACLRVYVTCVCMCVAHVHSLN